MIQMFSFVFLVIGIQLDQAEAGELELRFESLPKTVSILPTPFRIVQLSDEDELHLRETKFGWSHSNDFYPVADSDFLQSARQVIKIDRNEARQSLKIEMGGIELFDGYDSNFRQAFLTNQPMLELSSVQLEVQGLNFPLQIEFYRYDPYLPKDLWYRVPQDVNDGEAYRQEVILDFENGRHFDRGFVFSKCIRFEEHLSRIDATDTMCSRYPAAWAEHVIPLIAGRFKLRVVEGDRLVQEAQMKLERGQHQFVPLQ